MRLVQIISAAGLLAFATMGISHAQVIVGRALDASSGRLSAADTNGTYNTQLDKSPSAGGSQSSETAIAPQSSEPHVGLQGSGTAIGPQASPPALGQQGSGTALGPQSVSPALGPQSSSPALGPQSAAPALAPQTNGTAIAPPSSAPAIGPSGGTPIGPQGVGTAAGGTAIGPQGAGTAMGPTAPSRPSVATPRR